MKRWSIDERGVPWWSGGVDDRDARSLTDEDLSDLYAEDVASEMHAALVEAIHDAGRLRSLAAELDSHLNRGQTFTGAQVAVMPLAADMLLAADLLEGIEAQTTTDIPCRCEHCQRARSHRATSTTDGSGSLPPDDPGPSPTPAVGFIVTMDGDGTQFWVRREAWGALAVDYRPSRLASWFPLAGATVEVAP